MEEPAQWGPSWIDAEREARLWRTWAAEPIDEPANEPYRGRHRASRGTGGVGLFLAAIVLLLVAVALSAWSWRSSGLPLS